MSTHIESNEWMNTEWNHLHLYSEASCDYIWENTILCPCKIQKWVFFIHVHIKWQANPVYTKSLIYFQRIWWVCAPIEKGMTVYFYTKCILLDIFKVYILYEYVIISYTVTTMDETNVSIISYSWMWDILSFAKYWQWVLNKIVW